MNQTTDPNGNQESNLIVSDKQNLTFPYNNVKYEIPHFSKEEMVHLLSKVPPNRDGMLFQVLWRTGVRVSEVNRIEKQNLDFQNNEITIQWLKKRKLVYRKIPMHSSLKSPLYMFTGKMKYNDKLFPISRQRIDQLAKQYEFGHSHKIRHSFAINFLRQITNPFGIVILKEILGHSSIETTMNYLKVVPMAAKKELENVKFD